MDAQKLASLAVKNRIRAKLLSTDDRFRKLNDEQRQQKKIHHERQRREVGDRIRALKELAHYTFVEFVGQHARDPEYRREYWDGFVAAKPRIKELGVQGGEEYDRAMNALRFYWNVDSPKRAEYVTEVEDLLL